MTAELRAALKTAIDARVRERERVRMFGAPRRECTGCGCGFEERTDDCRHCRRRFAYRERLKNPTYRAKRAADQRRVQAAYRARPEGKAKRRQWAHDQYMRRKLREQVTA